MLTLSNCSNVQARHEVHEHYNEIISYTNAQQAQCVNIHRMQ